MKRKQKLPRRTRRPTPLKPSDNADIFTSPFSATENLRKIEEKSKMPINNLNDEKGKRSCETDEFKDRNGVHSQQSFYNSESSFLNHVEGIEKKPQETPINSDNSISKELRNTNVDALKRNLKRPIDDPALSVGVTKRPTAFGNFRNESEDGRMPVILNVFTLSQVPTSYIKPKTKNVTRKNNFPVTPPCSPPLPKLHGENTARFSSGNGKTKQPLKEHATISNVHNIYRSSVRHDRQNITNGSPAAMNQYMYQTNYTVEDQTRRFCNLSNSDSIQATVKNNVIPYTRKFAPTGFVLEERKPLSRSSIQKEQDISKVAKTSDFCVYSELPQDGQRKHFSNNEISSIANREQKDFDQSGLKSLPTSKNNAVFCDKLGPALEENKTGNIDNLNVLPEATLTCKTSYTMTQPINGSKSVAIDSHVFLSPRDIKVLQLKKRLQEQEAALNKLRKTL